MPSRLRLPIAIVAALVVAEAAVLLMRPRDRPAVVPASPRAYFTEAQIQRGDAFRSGQRRLFAGSVAVQLGVLVLAAARGPRLLAGARRPVLAGAAAAAGISVVLTVATLPLSAASRQRAKEVGLVTQGWGGWAGDVAKSTAIGGVLWGGAGALIVVGTRRFGRRWWLPAAAVVVGFGVVSVYAGPVVLDPVFNRFRALPEGTLRSDVVELARRAGVRVGEVYDMDASRRTTAANAYVNGIGPTKRVVLFDTLLRDFSPGEVRGVVAHELGHVRYRDVPHGLLYLALVTPLAMLATARLAERLAPERSLGGATGVPGVILAVALMSPPIAAISNQLSRAIERRADRFAMELTGDPQGLIGFQRKIAIQNVADIDPPRAWSLVFGTHPTTTERIGQAVAFEQATRR